MKLLVESIADEAAFQIAIASDTRRLDSEACRMRWWRGYAAFPEVWRDAAALWWEMHRETPMVVYDQAVNS